MESVFVSESYHPREHQRLIHGLLLRLGLGVFISSVIASVGRVFEDSYRAFGMAPGGAEEMNHLPHKLLIRVSS